MTMMMMTSSYMPSLHANSGLNCIFFSSLLHMVNWQLSAATRDRDVHATAFLRRTLTLLYGKYIPSINYQHQHHGLQNIYDEKFLMRFSPHSASL